MSFLLVTRIIKVYSETHCNNINEVPIKQVSTVKSLGAVYIDENLTWECHVNELSKKIAFGISAIKRIRHTVPYWRLYVPSTIH